MTGATDEQGSASYVYDGQGRLTQETRIIGAVSYTTSYGYDAGGNLQAIAYPTGRIVTYQRDTLGRVNAVLSQTSSSAPPALIAGNISYLPFGPVQSLTFGNGVVATYEYDQDYRPTGVTSSKGTTGIQNLTLTHDGADNITAIADALDTARSQTFEYDLLGRLTDAAGAYGTEEYTYDAVGNRLTRALVQGGNTTNVTYSYATGSNQLQSASNASTTRSFTYDDAGNTDSDSVSGGASFTYAYNHANRLKQSQESGGLTFNYGYDAFGERVLKQAIGQPRRSLPRDIASVRPRWRDRRCWVVREAVAGCHACGRSEVGPKHPRPYPHIACWSWRGAGWIAAGERAALVVSLVGG